MGQPLSKQLYKHSIKLPRIRGRVDCSQPLFFCAEKFCSSARITPCRWVQSNFVAGFKSSFAVGTSRGNSFLRWAEISFVDTCRRVYQDRYRLKRYFMLCYNIEQYVYDTSLHVFILIEANKFFLFFIAVFFDSDSRGTNFDISSYTQRFYSKAVVAL